MSNHRTLPAIYDRSQFGISFELFPPKTEPGLASLWKQVARLTQFAPDYITCTYGAGGSTQSKTLDVITHVKEQFEVPVASHLTCVGASVDDLRGYLSTAEQRGVDHIVALRGDPPQGETSFVATSDGFAHANELVALIRKEYPQFGIAVGGYPEVHQEAPNAESDLENLKRKVDAGADIVITQLFYHNDAFFRFRDEYERIGIKAPLIPGILPVTNLRQIRRITSLCGTKLPNSFVERLSDKDDADWQMQVGVEQATEQVAALVAAGVPGLHFYVLNKSKAASAVLDNLELPNR